MGATNRVQAQQVYGEVTVVAPTELRKKNYVVWQCLCSCGKTFFADTRSLSRGFVHDCGCGCSHNADSNSLVGQRFGRLNVTSFAGTRNGRKLWKCTCDCGNETVVAQPLLKSGKTKSCGCLRKEQTAKNAGLVNGSSTVLVRRFRERPQATNTSGCSGVYQSKRTGKWTAQITFKNKTKYLGSFECKEDAIAARKEAECIFDEYLAQVKHDSNRAVACEIAPLPSLKGAL